MKKTLQNVLSSVSPISSWDTLDRLNITKLGIILVLLFSLSCFLIHASCSQDNIVYLENGLQLSGNENQIIETDTLIIRGNIKLADNAHLKIINCNLTLQRNPGVGSQRIELSENSELELINSTIHQSAGLLVKDNGKLTVRNSTIKGSSHIWLEFKDNSSLSFIESNCFGKALQGSLHWGTEDYLPEGALREYWDDYRFSFEDSSSISIEESILGSVNVYQNSSCSINNSEIMLLDTLSSSETMVTNSKIKVLLASMTDIDFEYTGNIQGYHNEWNSESFFGPENKNNLRLIETSFDNLWLTLGNCNSNIHDAELFFLYTYQGETTVTDSEIKFLKLGVYESNVLDSTIEYVIGTTVREPVTISGSTLGFLGLSGQVMIDAVISDSSIDDCRINNFYMPDNVDVRFDKVEIDDLWLNPVDQFDLYFNNSQVNGEITLLRYLKSNENASIYGSVSFSPESSLKHYANTALTREYRVQVIEDGLPQSGVLVQLTKDGKTWMEYVTDQNGETRFKIKWVDYSRQDYFIDFHPNNLTETITISALETEKPLSLFSNTPIILEPTSPPIILVPLTIGIVTLLFGATLYILKKKNTLASI